MAQEEARPGVFSQEMLTQLLNSGQFILNSAPLQTHDQTGEIQEPDESIELSGHGHVS